MKKHLGTLLILIGIVIIVVPLVGRYVANKKQEEMMAEFFEQSMVVDESQEYDALGAALDWGSEEANQAEIDNGADEAAETVSRIDPETGEVIMASSDTETNVSDNNNLGDAETIKVKPTTVALLEIDKIDVYLPVAEGTDQATLKYALGHMTETADIGSIGNAVIAGHRGHSFGTYFSRLDEIVEGDHIKVSVGNKTYDYEVFETLRVLPDDLSVLRGSSDHRVLTLITCDPMYTSTHRLIVHAVVRDE